MILLDALESHRPRNIKHCNINIELSVLFTDDKEIRELNKNFRNKDKATDVLSFPLDDLNHLGDLVVSVETLKKQAKEFQVTKLEELNRLIVHGILHLHGFDHEGVGRSEAAKMRRMEKKLLEIIN